MLTDYYPGNDAAYANNLLGKEGLILGYFGGPEAYHVWSPSDWRMFPDNYKLPIWVAGLDGAGEAYDALSALHLLGVPAGKEIMVDMEGRIDKTYLEAFGDIMQNAGYKVLVYGEIHSVFGNPELNGYAVANPTGIEHMYPHPGVRLTQYEFGATSDKDAVKPWLVAAGDFWK